MGREINVAGILRAQSCATDARVAVREFHAAVAQPDTALVLFFCSSDYDLEALADEMAIAFAGVPVVGCTTAGEMGPTGCRDHSISGASLPASRFKAASGLLDHLQRFEAAQGEVIVQDLLQRLEVLDPKRAAVIASTSAKGVTHHLSPNTRTRAQ